MWLIQEHRLTHELTEGGGGSGREAEVRETGRGLVKHLDEAGSVAELVRRLMELNIRCQDDSRGGGAGRAFRVKIRDPFHPDTMPDWLKSSGSHLPGVAEAIYGFADRHRDKLYRHETRANVNGLSNFIDIMVATSGMLFVYLRRGFVAQHEVTSRLREYVNIFTGTLPQYRDEEATGYLGRVYTRRQGGPGLLKKTFAERNVAGHLRALLLVAQAARCGGNFDAARVRSQLPMLADQVVGFENRIGVTRATAAEVRTALEDYEMLTDDELEVWTGVVA